MERSTKRTLRLEEYPLAYTPGCNFGADGSVEFLSIEEIGMTADEAVAWLK